jgi:ribose 5-phosphate isomerase A
MVLKERAAAAAAALVESGMLVGLGTGSTAALVAREIARRLRAGEIQDVRGVPTSEATAKLARELEIPLTDLESIPQLDLTLDGADEVDPAWNLIKGGGGSLLREKIVAQASAVEVIVVDESKLVPRLGEKMPLPVEVVPFGWSTHLDFFRSLGGDPELRRLTDGTPFVTDEGNYTIDVRFKSRPSRSPLSDPHRLERNLLVRAGVVDTGLFLGMTTVLVVGRESGVDIQRKDVEAGQR